MQEGKTLLLIDGANLYSTIKTLGFDIDFKTLLLEFQARGNVLRANYYTAVHDEDFSTITPLIDWLNYNGYSVITKPTKIFTDAQGGRKQKGNTDIEIAVDAMEMAPRIERLVLFSGDGDFRSLVKAVQRLGVHVTVVSSISTQPPVCADELRRQDDVFIDLANLRPKIARDPASRAIRERRPASGLR